MGLASKWKLLMVMIFIGFGAAVAHGKVTEGVYFQPLHNGSDKDLVLQGTGIIRYLKVFKVAVAGFYLEEGTPAGNALADVPRRLEIQYLRSISAEDFARSTENWIAANVGAEAYERLRPRVEQLNRLYDDVEPGDRYALAYLPGKGTELFLNGISRGIVPGADFSSALFSIWLGGNPLSEALRESLLGRS